MAATSLDLDLVADRIEKRRNTWTGLGWNVGALTWRERDAFPLRIGPIAVDPDSVGVRLVAPTTEDVGCEFVVFATRTDVPSWADLQMWDLRDGTDTDSVIDEAPELPDTAALEATLTRLDEWLTAKSATLPNGA